MTYTTEKVSDKDDEHTTCDVTASIEGLKRVWFSMAVENDIFPNLLEGLRGGNIIVRRKLALKVFGLWLVDFDRGWRGLAPGRSRLFLRSFGLFLVCVLGRSRRKSRGSFNGWILGWDASHGLSFNGRFGGYGRRSLCVVVGHVVVKTIFFGLGDIQSCSCHVEQVAEVEVQVQVQV
jgi:hypothetical protein